MFNGNTYLGVILAMVFYSRISFIEDCDLKKWREDDMKEFLNDYNQNNPESNVIMCK